MPSIYRLLKLNRLVRSNRLKLLLIFMAQLLNRRYYSVRIDPVFACNLRCRMCYFSRSRKPNPEKFSPDELATIAGKLFGNALQVVVGCGAEPTMYAHFVDIVKKASEYSVPHISLVTNGQLLTRDHLNELAESGLNELVVSVHGASQQTYEHLMVGASWEKLHKLLNSVNEMRAVNRYPNFTLRVNYTVNPLNLHELETFFDAFGQYQINTLQIRPVMKIGGEYEDGFSQSDIHTYSKIIDKVRNYCREQGITLLANTDDPTYQRSSKVSWVLNETYKYVSPAMVVSSDFKWKEETLSAYLRRTGWYATMLKRIFWFQRAEKPDDLAQKYSARYDLL